MKIAELKRRLSEGVEFTVEFIGTNSTRCVPSMTKTRRRIVSNKTQMVSLILEGEKAGEQAYLTWKNVSAEERDGSIFLTKTDAEPPEEFLKITIEAPATKV